MQIINTSMFPTKGQGINSQIVALSGNNGWQVACKLYAIGSNQTRQNENRFDSEEEARQHFHAEVARFRQMLERVSDIVIEQGESEFRITRNGAPIVLLSYLPITRECA